MTNSLGIEALCSQRVEFPLCYYHFVHCCQIHFCYHFRPFYRLVQRIREKTENDRLAGSKQKHCMCQKSGKERLSRTADTCFIAVFQLFDWLLGVLKCAFMTFWLTRRFYGVKVVCLNIRRVERACVKRREG